MGIPYGVYIQIPYWFKNELLSHTEHLSEFNSNSVHNGDVYDL